MKYIHSIFLIFLISNSNVAQSLNLVSDIDLKVSSFVGIDSYKNIYFVKDMVLHKEGANGVFIFNDFQLGEITSVDIINPLKIVLFYEDTNVVVLLDNKLNEMERINFNNLSEPFNISTATNASNNSLWVFNIYTQQLELFNYKDNRKTTVSQPFTGKLLSQASDFNYCYTLTEKKLRSFNIYGSLITEFDNIGFEKITQHNKSIIALKGSEVFLFSDLLESENENSFNPLKIPVSEFTIKDLYLTKDFLYIYDGNKVYTFTITQPKK